MEIREASYAQDANYIRYVRAETLEGLGIEPTSELVEPVSLAKYLVAYEDSKPIGLAESVLLADVYETYECCPNTAIGELNAYCPFDEMAEIRTVYAAPMRRGSNSLFLSLTLAAAKLFHGLGARFATATTGVSSHALQQLYLKYGGEIAGQGCIDGIEMTLFVFDLEHLLCHRALERISRCFVFDTPHGTEPVEVS